MSGRPVARLGAGALIAATLVVALSASASTPSLDRVAPEGTDVGAATAEAPPPRASAASVERDPGLTPLRLEAPLPSAFEPGRTPFRLRVGEVEVHHDVMAVPILPGATVEIEVRDRGDSPDAAAGVLRYAEGVAEPVEEGDARWRWRAPSTPGVYPLEVERSDGVVRLNALVLHPRGRVRDGTLDGFRIGRYLETPLRGDPTYLPPDGFVQVGPELHDVLLSPHFTLGQFLCKQEGEPAYLAVSPALVRKLELVLEAVNDAGHPAPGLFVMSGFRTPWYNRAIGNTTSYSRHLWGDAADVWVDADGDGEMDDLNRDGRVDVGDGRVLSAIVEEVERREAAAVPGGLSVYRRNAAHGPFVHVDARGAAARW